MTDKPEPTVTQDARDAAVIAYSILHNVWEGYSECVAIEAGASDYSPFVQSFADFEAKIRSDQIERDAGKCESRIFHSDYPSDLETIRLAAQAIRNQEKTDGL